MLLSWRIFPENSTFCWQCHARNSSWLKGIFALVAKPIWLLNTDGYEKVKFQWFKIYEFLPLPLFFLLVAYLASAFISQLPMFLFWCPCTSGEVDPISSSGGGPWEASTNLTIPCPCPAIGGLYPKTSSQSISTLVCLYILVDLATLRDACPEVERFQGARKKLGPGWHVKLLHQTSHKLTHPTSRLPVTLIFINSPYMI